VNKDRASMAFTHACVAVTPKPLISRTWSSTGRLLAEATRDTARLTGWLLAAPSADAKLRAHPETSESGGM